MQKLEKYLMPLADVLTKNKVLIAIRDGFLITTPLLIVGSIFLLFANFPLPGWDTFMGNLLGPNWAGWFVAVSRASFNCTGLLTALGTGYAMAREFGGDKIQGAAVAMVAFFIMMPTNHMAYGPDDALIAGSNVSGLAFNYIGPNGIFMALLSAIVGVWLFCYAYKKGWTIKMPAGVPPAVTDSFAALIPSALVMGTAFLIRIGFSFTEYGYIQDFVVSILQTPLTGLGDTLAANLIYTFFCDFFWFFGINGPAVCNSVYFIGNVLTAEQLLAFEAGQPLPYIFTNPFSNFFAQFGGGGSTLSLVILMITVCKSKRIKQLGKLSIVPGIFGINEPIIFGLPVVLNPIIAIPFIFVPVINTVLSYYATLYGLIPRTTGVSLPWTTPIGFSGWLSTGSWTASVWQIFLLILGMVIYFPFIKTLDKKYLQDEAAAEEMASEEDEISFDDLDLEDL